MERERERERGRHENTRVMAGMESQRSLAQEIWEEMVSECEDWCQNEPVMKDVLYDAILKHRSLGEALGAALTDKLQLETAIG